jgi:hypothetical protein
VIKAKGEGSVYFNTPGKTGVFFQGCSANTEVFVCDEFSFAKHIMRPV